MKTNGKPALGSKGGGRKNLEFSYVLKIIQGQVSVMIF